MDYKKKKNFFLTDRNGMTRVTFLNDLDGIRPVSKVNYQLIGTKFPDSNDIYFRVKQKELVDQYAGARLFLQESEMEETEHWFNKSDDEEENTAAAIVFGSYFYEAALLFYNIVVDLSWTMTYSAVEFACSLSGKRVDLEGIKPIDEAVKLLRIAESNVVAPTAEETPFGYLKLMAPDFASTIDFIVDFWNEISTLEIRKKYNYCKHRGKPNYTELDGIEDMRLGRLFFQGDGGVKEMATCSTDVEYKVSLKESINELKKFDDERLFPYVKRLIKLIEDNLKPSPMAI